MAFCNNCGNELEPGSKFCANCGTPVAKETNVNAEVDVQEVAAEAVTDEATNAVETVEDEAANVAEAAVDDVVKTQDSVDETVGNGFPQPVMNQAQDNGFPQPVMNQAQGNGFPQPVMNQAQGNGFPQPMTPPAPKKPVNKKKVGIIIGIIAAVLVAIIATVTVFLVIDSNNKKKAEEERKKVHVNDYIVTEFTGYDTLGEGTVKLDKALISAIAYSLGIDIQKDDKGKFTETNDSQIDASSRTKYSKAVELYYTMQVKLDKSSELKNGDKVKIKLTYDEKLAKQLSLNILFDDKKIEVKGLDKITEVDPFSEENCIITQSGMDGSASISVDAVSEDEEGTWGYYVGYEYQGWSLSKDDVVKITISESTANYVLQECGVKFTRTEFEYTVKETDHYIKEASEISEKTVEAINEAAKEQIMDECSSDLIYKIDSTEYAGAYLMSQEDNDGNTVYMVYKLSMTLKNDEKIEGYVAVCVYNILQKSDGEQSYNEYTSVVYNSYENEDEDTIKAFKTDAAVYEYIFDRFANYTITKTEGIADYEVKLTEEDTKTISENIDELFTALNKKDAKKVRTLTMTKVFEKEYFKDWTNKEIATSITDRVEAFTDDGQFNSFEIKSMRAYPASKTEYIVNRNKENERGNYNFETIVELEVEAEYHQKGDDDDRTYTYTIFAYKVNDKWFLSYFIDGSVRYVFE